MAIVKISNVSMRGVSACVPKNIIRNTDSKLMPEEEINKFISSVGVKEFRVADQDTCTSDLAIHAAEKLIDSLKWQKQDIGIVVFVSQTPDYILPISSALIQDKLGLTTECLCFDMMLGCSGFTYGLSTIGSYLQNGTIKKGLLICGDTLSKTVSPKDKSVALLFGDAATVTAFEYDETASDIFLHLGTDGSGYKAIMIKDGAARHGVSSTSLIDKTYDEGIIRNDCNLYLDGMDVFSFGITQAPKTCNALLRYLDKTVESIDTFVFHQANMMMNEMVRKKLKLAKEKVLYSIEKYGNTSSASIPITMVHAMKNLGTENNPEKLLLCGFGVGLSWATAYIEVKNLVIPEIIEI
jgi:3-oxoacyl-[acyl-carrier-protein] synthase III